MLIIYKYMLDDLSSILLNCDYAFTVKPCSDDKDKIEIIIL